MNETALYPIRPWRTIYDIFVSYAVIALAVASVYVVSWWLYPVVAVIVANRILALSLLCHEGLHGNLHPNLKVNDFIGRYFCAFPTFISFSKYRRLHLLHHGTVGSDKWDPDRHLYASYPMTLSRFLWIQFSRLVTFRTLIDFLAYYTEFPELLTRKRLANGKLFVFSSRSDLIPFLLFHLIVMSLVVGLGYGADYLLLITLPVLLITQPYVLLMGGLQHGPTRSLGPSGVSRSIRGSRIYMWLLLPVDICFHGEHHKNASVPHYWLKTYARDLEGQGENLWKSSYREALVDLFSSADASKDETPKSAEWLKRADVRIQKKV